MALFHLNVSSIGKAAGSSAVASAAYRSCSSLVQSVTDSQTGLEVTYLHNFSNKKGLAFSQIFAPEEVAEWCYDREKLWNKVEARETHIKGRFARDIKLALQTEFTLEQNIQLLSEYVKNTFVSDGIIADVNIHMDDINNPHAHIMLTTRSLEINDNDELVFGNKNRLLDSNGWLKHIRGQWADINNKYFAIYGIDKTITHESYETRGLDFIKPTIHEGAARHTEDANNVLERTESNRHIVSENLQYIKNNPAQVVQAIAKNKSGLSGVFSRDDLFKCIDDFLSEIATREGDHQVLINEARAAIFTECDKMFKGINQSDLSLGKEFGLDRDSSLSLDSRSNAIVDGGNITISNNDSDNSYDSYLLNKRSNKNDQNNKNNKSDRGYISDRSSIDNQNIKPTIQENIISLIEDFFKKAEGCINVSDEFEFIKLNPIKLIEKISKNKAIFSKADLAKELDTHINETILKELKNENLELLDKVKVEILEKYDDLLFGLINSSELIKLVEADLEGREVYTTKSQLNLEKEFISNVEQLAGSKQHSLNLKELTKEKLSLGAKIVSGLKDVFTPTAVEVLEKIISQVFGSKKDIILSDEQNNAVLKLVNGSDIICLSGMPGTGKSTVMAKLVKEYKAHGYEVVGGAVSAVAATNLGAEAGINSTTLSKWKYDWDLRATFEAKGEDVKKLFPYLTNKNVFIIDEMSMVDLATFNYIASKVAEAGAKLIAIGDNNQFSAIGVGGASEKIAERAENIVLTELFRQQSGLDKEITRKLANYRVDEALVALDQEGRVRIGNSPELTRNELVNHYINQIHQDKNNKDNHLQNETRIVIAYRNDEVKELNLEIRTRLLSSGLLHTKDYGSGGREFNGKNGKIKIALGEQLVFTKNQRYLGVLNGQLGKVVGIIDNSRFKVQLLGKNAKGKSLNKVITINNDKFNNFDYGYAITSYKSQGKTYDHSYLLLDKSVGYESFNVMATRHRLSSVFYIAKHVLNEIISRKFESLKGIYHQSEEFHINENAALFELLVKRNPNSLAHDYLGYETKAEVLQIKEYLELRNAASGIYRELLEWQEDERFKGNLVELWDNGKLWAEFIELVKNRGEAAKELVEGYQQHYQKYISSSLINYATLSKHAKEAEIEFNYLDVSNAYAKKQPIEVVKFEYQQLLHLHQSYLSNPNNQTADLMYDKAEEVMTIHHECQFNLARLSSKIAVTEDAKWELESQKQANIYYREDFKYFLDNTYKEGSKVALTNWKKFKNALGVTRALAQVKDKPESLGSLLGIGLGKVLPISDKRVVAVFNLRSLVVRLEGYEKSIDEELRLNSEIHQKNTMELEPLKERYQYASLSKSLSQKQERFVDKLLEQKENSISKFEVDAQLQQDQMQTQEQQQYHQTEEAEKLENSANKNNLDIIDNDDHSHNHTYAYTHASTHATTHINSQQLEKIVQQNPSSLLKPQSQQLSQEIEEVELDKQEDQKNSESVINEIEQSSKLTKARVGSYKPKNYVNNTISVAEIHDKLAGNIVNLAQQLLPAMSNKKIIIDKNTIKCGSINIVLHGNKRGLWSRFSRVDEKGNLFDLIRISQRLTDKGAAIEWSKSYLGLDRENKHLYQTQQSNNKQIKTEIIEANREIQEEFKVPSFRILSPVPQNAAIFNPKAVFALQLRNKDGENKEIEEVYAYRNIKNELCGYVVRIKDIAANTKVTLPAVYTENKHGIRSWRAKGLGEERCLYNEQRLYNSHKPVLIVEGEKAADSAQSHYSEFDVVTWSGGVNGFNKTNWSVLQGKQVTIWPDNDEPGIKAAHNIKSLLESKDITKASIIDLSKIEFLPEKWDLADKLPEDVRQHQITGALYEAKGIADNVRITKTLQDWKSYSNTDLDNKEFKSLGEYMLNKQAIKYQLHFEQILLKDKLQKKAVLSNLDGMLLDLEATKLVDNNIKSLSLSAEATSETISNQIQQDLAQIHQTMPKEVLIKATKIAMENSQAIIDEHDHNQNHKLSFTKADLPSLSLALASEIVELHYIDNKDDSIANVSNNLNLNSARHQEHQEMSQHDLNNNDPNHSINMIRVVFKARIEQEGRNFEQHQQYQQVMQRQMSQHQGIEI